MGAGAEDEGSDNVSLRCTGTVTDFNRYLNCPVCPPDTLDMQETGGAQAILKARPNLDRAAKKREATRRRAERVATSKNVQIYPCTPEGIGRPVQSNLCDMSKAGCGLIHKSAMAQEQVFGIIIATPEGVKQIMLYRVVRCATCGDKIFRIGAKYVATCSSGKEVTQVLATAAQLRKLTSR